MLDGVLNSWTRLALKGGSLLGYFPPKVAWVTGRLALSIAALLEKRTRIGLSPAIEHDLHRISDQTDPVDMSVNIAGFGDLSHPVGLGAGYERDGSGLEFLPLMGVSFAEVGSLALDNQEVIFHAPRVRSSRGDRSISVDLPGDTVVWPRPFLQRGLDPQRIQNVFAQAGRFQAGSGGGFPFGFNLEVPLQLGNARAASLTVSAIDYLLETRPDNLPGRVFRLPVILSWGGGSGAVSKADILRAVANEIPAWRDACPGLALWIKQAPGMVRSDFEKLVETIVESGFSGIVVGSARPVTWPGRSLVCGTPALAASNDMLEWAWSVHRGSIQMIGSGGVMSGEDAFQKILRGAAAVEIMSALWLYGPFAALGILAGLEGEIRRAGVRSVSECVGAFFDG